jgi:hypothetical protein
MGLKKFEEDSDGFTSQIALDAFGASAFSGSRIFIRGRIDQCGDRAAGATGLRATAVPAAGLDVDAGILGLWR